MNNCGNPKCRQRYESYSRHHRIGLGDLPGFEAAKDFVQIKKRYKPNPENKAIYDNLFVDYKNIYKSLEKAYIIANGQRFTGEEN